MLYRELCFSNALREFHGKKQFISAKISVVEVDLVEAVPFI